MKIYLLGDKCTDEYHYGVVERLSPEAPVPILRSDEKITKGGMALNVLKNLEAFNLNVTFISSANLGGIKVRYIDKHSGQHLLRVDYEVEAEPLQFIPDMSDADAIVISDYCKGFLTTRMIERIIHEFPSKPIFIDTKKKELGKFEGAYVKVNLAEFRASTSACSDLIVTLGDKGAMYQGVQYETSKVAVFDVCGAGDTFLASLVYSFLADGDIVSAIKFANRASAISVQHSGVYVLTGEDINALCQNS